MAFSSSIDAQDPLVAKFGFTKSIAGYTHKELTCTNCERHDRICYFFPKVIKGGQGFKTFTCQNCRKNCSLWTPSLSYTTDQSTGELIAQDIDKPKRSIPQNKRPRSETTSSRSQGETNADVHGESESQGDEEGPRQGEEEECEGMEDHPETLLQAVGLDCHGLDTPDAEGSFGDEEEPHDAFEPPTADIDLSLQSESQALLPSVTASPAPSAVRDGAPTMFSRDHSLWHHSERLRCSSAPAVSADKESSIAAGRCSTPTAPGPLANHPGALIDRLSSLQEDLPLMKQAIQGSFAEMDRLMLDKQQLENRLQESQAERDRLATVVKALTDKTEKLQKESEQMLASHTQTISVLCRQVEQKTESLAQAEKQHRAAEMLWNSERRQLVRDTESALAELKQLRSEIGALGSRGRDDRTATR